MHARKRIAKLRDFLRSLCFLCPSFLGVCLFFIVPFAVVVKYALTDSAGADAASRMTPALRKARLGEERKQSLFREAEGAAERMLNHLLHGMRSRMDDDTFRKCLNAMDEVLCEDSPGAVRAEGTEGAIYSI